MRINIGSGKKPLNDFITCDFDKSLNPDYCFNVGTDIFPFEDNSIEFVLAHHILQQLSKKELLYCMKELYRICKPRAKIDIRVPHYRNDKFWEDPFNENPITENKLKVFSKKYCELLDKQDSSISRVANILDVDFEIIRNDLVPEEIYRDAFTGQTKVEVERYISEHNNIVSEVHVMLAVIKGFPK